MDVEGQRIFLTTQQSDGHDCIFLKLELRFQVCQERHEVTSA